MALWFSSVVMSRELGGKYELRVTNYELRWTM